MKSIAQEHAHQLTSDLPFRPVLPRSHIREIAKRLAAREPAREPTRKVLNLAGVINNARLVADSSQTLQIRVDTHNHPRIRWAVVDILLRPLGDAVAKVDRCLAAAFFAEAEELVVEDHAVAIDED